MQRKGSGQRDEKWLLVQQDSDFFIAVSAVQDQSRSGNTMSQSQRLIQLTVKGTNSFST